MKAKDRVKRQLVEYLTNLDMSVEGWPTYAYLSTEVCKYKCENQLSKLFTADEKRDLELEVLEARRKRYARDIVEVDAGLLKQAKKGNAKSAKLVYQKFEGWAPKTKQEHSFDKENLLEIISMLSPAAKDRLIKAMENKLGGS
jgi:hypothetical protein